MDFVQEWLKATVFFIVVAFLGRRRGQKRKFAELDGNVPDEDMGGGGSSSADDQGPVASTSWADSGRESRQPTPAPSTGAQGTEGAGGTAAGPSTTVEQQAPPQAAQPAAQMGQQGAGGAGVALSLKEAFGTTPPTPALLKTAKEYGVKPSDLRDCRIEFEGEGDKQTVWRPANLQRTAMCMAVIVHSVQRKLRTFKRSPGLLAVILARTEDLNALRSCLTAMLKGEKGKATNDKSPTLTLGELTSSGKAAKHKEMLLLPPSILLTTPHRLYVAYQLMDDQYAARNLTMVAMNAADLLASDANFHLCLKALKSLQGTAKQSWKLMVIDEAAVDITARFDEADNLTQDQQQERERARILKRGGNPKVLDVQSYKWDDFQGLQLYASTVSAGVLYEARAFASDLRTLASKVSPSPSIMEVFLTHMYNKTSGGTVLLLQRDVVSLAFPSGSILEQESDVTQAARLMQDTDWFKFRIWTLNLRKVKGDKVHNSTLFLINVNAAGSTKLFFAHFDSMRKVLAKKDHEPPLKTGFYSDEEMQQLASKAQDLLRARRAFQETQGKFSPVPPLSKLDLEVVKIEVPRQLDHGNDSAMHAFAYSSAVLEKPPTAAITKTDLTSRRTARFAAFGRINLNSETVRRQMKAIAAELLEAQSTVGLDKLTQVAVNSYLAQHSAT